jgi:hypothetical protein
MATSKPQVNEILKIVDTVQAAASKREAYEMLGQYFSDYSLAVSRPPFDYKTSFSKTEGACTAKFSRTFAHTDWRDGQDLVQAEETLGEKGFNIRFHQIEKDFDGVKTDLEQAFTCMKAMRESIFNLLAEIKTEVNLIIADVNKLSDCCRDKGPFTIDVGELYPGGYYGTIKYLGRPMNVFKTEKGLTLVPQVNPVDGGGGDPRIRRVADLGRTLEKSRKLKYAFRTGPLTKERLVKDFGDVETDGGDTIRDILDILPDRGSYSSPESLIKAVAEREAAAIRTSGYAEDVLASELGDRDGAKTVTDAAIDEFELIPDSARTALIAAGVDTVGKLAKGDLKDLTEKLEREGVEATRGDAAEWVAAARTIALVGR